MKEDQNPLTVETINRDPLAAIHRPIPAEADQALLESVEYAAWSVRNWTDEGSTLNDAAHDRLCEVGELLPPSKPESEQYEPGSAENREWQQAMKERLPGVMDWTAQAIAKLENESERLNAPAHADGPIVTLAAIGRDPWAAVYMPLPEKPDAALVKGAHHSAEYCYEAAINRAENPDSPAHSAHEPQRNGLGSDSTPTENAAAALDRMEALERIDPTLTRVGPHSIEGQTPPDGPGHDDVGERRVNSRSDGTAAAADPWHGTMRDHADGQTAQQSQQLAEAFKGAGQATTSTPQADRERDVAQIIDRLADANGLQDSVELGAFTLAQEMRGDAITHERDPEKRAELRNEREAIAHEYAANLSDRLAVGLRAAGSEADAADMEQHAETRREIAAEIRNPTPPDRSKESVETRDDFARAAENASGLGPTAQTIHVAERPTGHYAALKTDEREIEPQPDMERARENAQNRLHIRPEIAYAPEGAVTLTVPHTMHAHRESDTDEREAQHLERINFEISQRTQTERDAESGRTDSATVSADPRMAERAAEVREIKESLEREDSGESSPERGQDTSHAAFRSFGRGP
jgi:hypothetical protein